MSYKAQKSWDRLPLHEKLAIAKLKEEEKWRDIRKFFVICQRKWLKMAVIVGHDYLGWTTEQCYLFLANFREVYRINKKMGTDKEQEKWLNGKMDEIFGKGKYPEEYIDKLEEL